MNRSGSGRRRCGRNGRKMRCSLRCSSSWSKQRHLQGHRPAAQGLCQRLLQHLTRPSLCHSCLQSLLRQGFRSSWATQRSLQVCLPAAEWERLQCRFQHLLHFLQHLLQHLAWHHLRHSILHGLLGQRFRRRPASLLLRAIVDTLPASGLSRSRMTTTADVFTFATKDNAATMECQISSSLTRRKGVAQMASGTHRPALKDTTT